MIRKSIHTGYPGSLGIKELVEQRMGWAKILSKVVKNL
jgi:hypothetical protein